MKIGTDEELEKQRRYWFTAVLAAVDDIHKNRGKIDSNLTFTATAVRKFLLRNEIRISSEDIETLLSHMDFSFGRVETSDYAETRYILMPKEFTLIPEILRGIADRSDCADIFEKFELLGTDWLFESLNTIVALHDAEALERSDVEGVQSLADDWEPLELEYDTPEAKEFAEKLSEATQAIEGDNGYAVHHPAERQHVVSTLKHLQSELSERAPFTRAKAYDLVVKPLTQVVSRLKNSLTAEAAKSALRAFGKWVENNVANILDWIS